MEQLSPLRVLTLSSLPSASSYPGALVQVSGVLYWSDGSSWYQVAPATGGGGGGGGSTFSTARVRRTTSLSVAANTWTTVSFDAEDWDTANYWTSSQNTRITVPATGYYLFIVRSNWALATGTRWGRLMRNGNTGLVFDAFTDYANSTTGLSARIPHGTVLLSLNEGDYVEAQVFSSAATTLNSAELVVARLA